MDPISSRVMMAASSGETPEFWGPAYLHGAISKVAMIETADQPATLVAVGENGLLLQRDTNGDWQALALANNGSSGSVGDITDIVSNGSAIVATVVNSSLGIIASTTLDGLSQYSFSSGSSPTNGMSVAWSEELGIFAAIAGSGIYLSEGGYSWSGPKYGGPGGNSIVWTGSAFLASTGSSIYRSADGEETWEALTTPSLPNGSYYALRYLPLSPSGYVVVLLGVDAYGNGIFSYTSNNGDFWTQVYGYGSTGPLVDISGPGPFSVSFPSSSDLGVLSYYGKVYSVGGTLLSDTGSYATARLYWDDTLGYIVGGGSYNSSCVLKVAGDDVGPWEPVSPSPEYTLKALAWDGTRFIAMGYGIDVYSSTDALSWEVVATIPVSAPTPGAPLYFNSVADLVWTGTFFCGVGTTSGSYGRIVHSTDGVTWTVLSQITAGYYDYYAVGWSGSVLCAGGRSGKIAVSSDGLSWAFRTPPSGITRDFNGIAWGNSTWVMVGDSGTVITAAEDGATWTDYSLSGVSTDLTSVAYGNSLFVAVGGTSVYTSPTGNGWTLRSQPISEYSLTSVTWTGDRFVAVFSGGQVIASDDGITWTTLLERQSAEEAEAKIVKRRPLLKVRAGAAGRYVVAVGDGGSVTLTPRPSTPPFPKA